MTHSINIDIAPQPSSTTHHQIALEHALRSAWLARELSLDTQDHIKESSLLSGLSHVRTFILSGSSSYGGAIKGEAALGFFEYHMSDCLKELQYLEKNAEYDPTSKASLLKRKEHFLKEHGISQSSITGETMQQLNLLHLALWETFKDTPLMAPTSGSFGLAFLETLRILRQTNIAIDGKTIPLFRNKEQRHDQQGDGKIVVWAPDIALDIMTPEKTKVLAKSALTTGSKIAYWQDRNKRDVLALVDAMKKGGFFCPTNPKSVEEVKELVEDVFREKGESLFLSENGQKTLKSLGIAIETEESQIKLTVHSPIAGGMYGLMVPHLHELDSLLSKNIKAIDTFNQPSVGATLAATALVDMILNNKPLAISDECFSLLHELFPNIHAAIVQHQGLPTTNLHGTFDVANSCLANEVGYQGVNYPHNNNPANGLGTITPGKLPLDVLRQSMEAFGSFKGKSSMHPVPHNFMEIARSLLFAAEIEIHGDFAKYPESAGAASLGGWLHDEVKSGKLTADDIAWSLRKNGISFEIFEKLQKEKSGIDYLVQESEIHQNGMPTFTQTFLEAMKKPFESLRISPHLTTSRVNQQKALTFFNTGSNGTEWAKEHIKTIVQKNHNISNTTSPSSPKNNLEIDGISSIEVVSIITPILSDKVRGYEAIANFTQQLFPSFKKEEISQLLHQVGNYASQSLQPQLNNGASREGIN